MTAATTADIMCLCGQGPFTQADLAAHVARMAAYRPNLHPQGLKIAGTSPAGPHGAAPATRPYTFEVMSPSGQYCPSVTVMAADRDSAAELAAVKVEESGEEVLDIQDNIIVVPDESGPGKYGEPFSPAAY